MADVNGSQAPSSLLQYLPAIFQQDAFTGQFLLAFEKILLGRQDGIPFQDQGLEETIASMASLFDPLQTREDFLPWLANWTAFTLRADLDVTKQRKFIAQIVQHYLLRGTKQNLEDLLRIFTAGTPTISEATDAEFEIGVHSTIGLDTYLSGGMPNYFHVTISLPDLRSNPTELERQLSITRSLIELEKPAHTIYDLDVIFPSMQIGVHSSVGVDTMLGSSN
jgi:phage tail-like protein